jgi:ATP-dependent DNA helicase RecG
VLARALEFLGIVENRYSGIPTMRRVFQLAGLPEPRFADSRGDFAVTFFNSSDHQISDSRRSSSRTARAYYDNSSVPDLGCGYVGERQAIKFDALPDYCRLPRSRIEIADFLGVATVHWVMVHYINPLLQDGSLIMTRPEVPKSKLQQYIRT